MAYVDLRERRKEEQRRESERTSWATVGRPYVLLVAGLVLAIPAVAASYAALVGDSTNSWMALVYWLPPAALLLWVARRFGRQRRGQRPSYFGAEKSLLLAMRDAGGAITPATAALETPLTVDEADGILSKLANDGHLRVESHDGALYYVLPSPPRPGPLGRH